MGHVKISALPHALYRLILTLILSSFAAEARSNVAVTGYSRSVVGQEQVILSSQHEEVVVQEVSPAQSKTVGFAWIVVEVAYSTPRGSVV